MSYLSWTPQLPVDGGFVFVSCDFNCGPSLALLQARTHVIRRGLNYVASLNLTFHHGFYKHPRLHIESVIILTPSCVKVTATFREKILLITSDALRRLLY